jgi:hypothetical protein
MKLPLCIAALFGVALTMFAQAPGVPIIKEGHGPLPELRRAAEKLRQAGGQLSIAEVKTQLSRKSCELTLPPVATEQRTPAEIWERARRAMIRVGHYYLCTKCDRWHLNLSGGYAITADGVVATCHHVVEPRGMRDGFLVASTFDGELLPVVEILAADKATDTCILRVKSPRPLEPLPLNTHVRPGDDAWCLSDPLGRDGYFTKGIVNRFYQHVHPGRKRPEPIRMNVSTDWAPGSSGAAVLDTCGNAIGHVSLINAEENDAPGDSKDDPRASGGGTLIVFHDAVRAADVLALIKAPQTKKP